MGTLLKRAGEKSLKREKRLVLGIYSACVCMCVRVSVCVCVTLCPAALYRGG